MSSFPNVIYGDYGDEKVAQSTKIGSLPLGTLMILPDGRKFRQAKVSATAGVAGQLYQQNDMGVIAGTADTALYGALAVAASVSVGAITLTVTLGGTAAISTNLLEDGYLHVATSAGVGHVHKIKSCGSAASGASLTVNLYETDPIKVALAASSTKVGLRQNEYDNLTVTTANTVRTGPIAGILPVAASASFYTWVQRSGPATALTDGTVIIGVPVIAATAVGGAVAVAPAVTATAEKHRDYLGYCMSVAASASYSLVNLKLE